MKTTFDREIYYFSPKGNEEYEQFVIGFDQYENQQIVLWLETIQSYENKEIWPNRHTIAILTKNSFNDKFNESEISLSRYFYELEAIEVFNTLISNFSFFDKKTYFQALDTINNFIGEYFMKWITTIFDEELREAA